jgi:ADP-ribosyl-[dinitrogen reductase] hydrolase
LQQSKSVRAVGAELGNTGYVVDSVPLAIYAASKFHDSVEQSLREIASAGGDADTNAALTGQIIGATQSNISAVQPLLDQIEGLAEYCAVIEQFGSYVSANSPFAI